LPPLTCDQGLWNHFYNKSRLAVSRGCITVTGTVVSKEVMKDGDLHIQLKLDPGQARLLNSANYRKQGGNLVVELICVGDTEQAKCQNYHQDTVAAPAVGARVKVFGVHVRDKNHGWKELHPVTSITVL
jgi:hypothetical protein